MKIILRKEVDKLGAAGEIVTVKNGYARNFLIPKGMANRATDGTIKAVETEKKQRAFKIEKERKAAQSQSESLSNVSLTVKAKAGDEGRLYGTVTTQMIADALKAKGHDIDRKRIDLDDTIKSLGTYAAKVKLYTDVVATVNFTVEAE
ncbi:MAG: 50S ribosomal protein L9 [Rhizobacter sp.]|nr:50S ribosomal protein L9 [Chlorobiales bacterium]